MKKNKLAAVSLAAVLLAGGLADPCGVIAPAVTVSAEEYSESVSKITYDNLEWDSVDLIFRPAASADSYEISYYNPYVKKYVKCDYKLSKTKDKKIKAAVTGLSSVTEYKFKIVPTKKSSSGSIKGKAKNITVKTAPQSPDEYAETLFYWLSDELERFYHPEAFKIVGSVYRVVDLELSADYLSNDGDYVQYEDDDGNYQYKILSGTVKRRKMAFDGFIVTVSCKDSNNKPFEEKFFLIGKRSSYEYEGYTVMPYDDIEYILTADYNKFGGGMAAKIFNKLKEGDKAITKVNVNNKLLNEKLREHAEYLGY